MYCWLDLRRWWHLKKQVAIVIQTLSLYPNLSLPSSVNKKPQRDKRRAGKLIQGSHCESQMRVRFPPLSSPQPDGNSRLWHCHNFASLLLRSLFLPFHFKAGGLKLLHVTHSGEKREGKNCITPQSRMPWEQDEMYLLLLNNSGII